MKKILLTLSLLALAMAAFAQLNMSLQSQVNYNTDLNDIWGWAAPDGTEYALVGKRNGVSIVSLADPTNATEVASIPGQQSTWRDLKTWGNFAYVVTDQGGTTEGVTVIDLSGLPNSIDYYHWTPNLENLGLLNTCHNIYIDDSGFAYLAGCNLNNGGMLILNVNTATGEPEFVTAAPPAYAHDVYVSSSNKMYASEIYAGQMAIYDVSDKNAIQLLATQPTPFNFTHNIWVNDEETVAFTTDERANAPVAAYDITDLNNIVALDQYRPVATTGSGVIPHNVHVWDNYLLISYYTDGGRVVDASRPTNLIEVGNYDSWLGQDGGFDGAWGLYPYLPSRSVLVTDIQNGLYVLQPNFVRACWLEGIVTDSLTGAFLKDVEVVINSSQPNYDVTNAFGVFETGQAISGNFEVSFTKAGYQEKIIPVTLENGQLTELDVELVPLVSYSISGQAIRDADGDPVPFANVLLQGEEITYSTTADDNGNFLLEDIYQGIYTVYAGAWGYRHAVVENLELTGNSSTTLVLEEGYQDDFIFDQGWTLSNLAPRGRWELGVPNGTTFQGSPVNPGADAPDDLGFSCYVTGNGGGGAGDDDVDDGTVTLISPPMDLTGYADPVLTFQFWFFNGSGFSPPNDALSVRLNNGAEEVEIFNTSMSLSNWLESQEFHLAEFIGLTGQVRVIFETSDFNESGHLVEAAVDQILVTEQGVTATNEANNQLKLEAFPNPFREEVQLRYQLEGDFDRAVIRLFNSFGQEVQRLPANGPSGQAGLGRGLPAGIYWARLEVDGQTTQSLRLVKVN